MSNHTIITIARQYGSAGREIGEKLAKRLDVPFYDKALIAMAAKESGYSEEVFEKADERASNSLLYSLLMGSYSFGAHSAPVNNMPINDKLFLIQADIIKEVVQKGPCVIVGRCADYILRENNDVLNVFVHADKLNRMDHIVQSYGEPVEKAADIIVKKDKQRANYYNFYTNQRWGDPENYHLTLNSYAVGVDNAVELILSAADMKERQGI